MVRLLLSRTGAMAIQVKPYDDPEEVPVAVAVRPLPVMAGDVRLSYKTTARAFMEVARREGGKFETIFVDPDGHVTEGSFTSIFVERDGKYLTPPLERGLLPGLLRARLIEEGKAEEADLTVEDLAGGFLIGNMVRGLIEARLA
jgi:para-aminobenzoate synthetase/4-amino-4-deoxychorismate lyase